MKTFKYFKILSFMLLIIAANSCKEDLTVLDVKFTADKTNIQVGDAVTFTVTGSADYWSIFPFGNTEITGTEVEVDEEKKLETSKLEVVYDTPGTYFAKCVGTVLNSDDLTVEYDSAFITIIVTDNAEGAHTKFSLFNFTLKDDHLAAVADNSSLRYYAIGEITGNNVTVHVPYSTLVGNLIPEFKIISTSKAYINGVEQYSLKSAQDFSAPVEYHIVSNDGTEVVNTVTVIKDPKESNTKLDGFNLYKIPSGISSTSLKTDNNYVVVVSDTFDLSAVKSEFTLATFAKAYINDVELITKKTEADFTAPVNIKVVAEDETEKVYTVNVFIKPQFSRFYFGSENEFVGEGYYNETKDTVFVSNPTGADVTALSASFKTLPYDATVKVGDNTVSSGNDTQDFSNPVTYTITGDITSQIVVVIE